ncbi:ABC transporter substrate-binding protein [Cohnella sp. CIP 111063]|uniref:extracellular solute-binding protein n=1 Tax=unclassified Cohnella TaxID=2636738 RepID=UPI000B9CBDFD|nr:MULTISPECIES: extracellular solute-binding protein [unclassified Cohnella]OXS54786.1 ABC transporter substrate-binding protein [Cohnella sp. CIP 111063]PRX64595.1 ABC-type glycerol-3-phosphate transport system substrate-binding protein [Cohnella sp. SGD-V74]
MTALLLAGAMALLPAMTGCSKGEQTEGSPSASSSPSASTATGAASPSPAGDRFELGSEPLEFSFYGNYDWYTMPKWGGDLSSQWIKENKKVDVIAVNSGGSAMQKLSTMIVSNNLPDVIWTERDAEVEKLRAAGMLVPFDDYLDKYPNLKKWAGEETLNMLRSSDGKLYQFPNWYTSTPQGNAGYVVNSKIYKELGSPKLETTDDLYAYLKQVKEKYPDVVPFEAGEGAVGIDTMYSAFGENRTAYFTGMMGVPEGNELKSLFLDPAYRESLQFANKLYREKLMTQDAFSQNGDHVSEKVTTGRVAVFASATPTQLGARGDTALREKDPEAGYFMIWPIHKAGLDKNKIYPGNYNQLGWNVSVITKAAKNPEAIFAFLDWFTGPEGQRIIIWGPEGMYWEGAGEDGAPKFTEKFVTDPVGRNKLMDSTGDLQWNGNTTFIDQSKMKFEQTLAPDQQNWETRWQSQITWKTQMNVTEFSNLDPTKDSPEGIIAQSVNDILLKVRAQAVLNAKSEEEVAAMLDQAEKDAQKVGYAQLLKYKTDSWQENLKRIGK